MNYINGKRKPKTPSLGSTARLSVIMVFPAFFVWSNSHPIVFFTRAYCFILITTSIILSLCAITNNSGRGLGIVALLVTLTITALLAGLNL